MPSILFVCTANRFRSPIAAAYFTRQLALHGDEREFSISSAGTWTAFGQPVTADALAIARNHGLDLSSHRSRPVSTPLLTGSDLILVMAANHQEAIRQEFPGVADRVHLLSKAAGLAPFDVPDPYTSDEPPELVAQEIMDMIDKGYDRIITLSRTLSEGD